MSTRVAIALLVFGLAGCAQPSAPGPSANPAPSGPGDVLPHGVSTVGVYPLETTPDGTPFRWTNGNATIEGPIYRSAPKTLQLTLFALFPTQVRVSLGRRVVYDHTVPAGTLPLSVPVSRADTDPALHITSPMYRPPVPAGTASRDLGVEIRRLDYTGAAPARDAVLTMPTRVSVDGLYPIEQDPQGVPFRWTDGHATLGVPAGEAAGYVLRWRAYGPTPVTILVDGRRAAPVTAALEATVRVRLAPGSPHRIEIISPTFRPTPVGGYTRTLGVQVVEMLPIAASSR